MSVGMDRLNYGSWDLTGKLQIDGPKHSVLLNFLHRLDLHNVLKCKFELNTFPKFTFDLLHTIKTLLTGYRYIFFMICP